MAEKRRAALLIKLVLFTAVLGYGWFCGTSPLVASVVAASWRSLFAAPAHPAGSSFTPGPLSPAFSPEVRRWEPQIMHWSAAYQLDPNVIATLMQIESCGDPHALSPAGAQGLFQVMPFHFQDGDDAFDPQTNAARGLAYFADSLKQAGGDLGQAFAAYNGGQSLIGLPQADWPNETVSYYQWATGIMGDVRAGRVPSPTLQHWLDAGGSALCRQAAQAETQGTVAARPAGAGPEPRMGERPRAAASGLS